MTKKQSASREGRNNGQGRKSPGKARRNWTIAVVALIIVAVAAGTVAYLLKRPSTPASTASGYAISGTVDYGGTRPPGRVYLEIADSSGRDTGVGTSIASPGPYIIRGLASGAYRISAWMDDNQAQLGIPTAMSPTGSISVTVNNGDVSQQNMTIVDADPTPSATAPAAVNISPGNGSALVQWAAPQASDGNVLAQSYNVYYGTSSSVSPSNGTKKTVQANNHVFISGLNDETTYYFVVTAVLGGNESPPSDPPASATIGAKTGSNTVSGNVTFPGQARGPLYVGISSQNGTLFQRIEKPVSPQAYKIPGVPTGGYDFFSVVDMNGNGVIDIGDMNKASDELSGGRIAIYVRGDMTGVDQSLSGTNVLARVITIHFAPTSANITEVYSLEFEVQASLKLPVKVALISGPDVAVPVDMGGNYYYRIIQTLAGKPEVGNKYELSIAYSDGTTEKVSVPITGVLVDVPQNLNATGTDRTVPTFSWTAPASAPATYTYLIQLGQTSIGQEWMYPPMGGMPSSQTSVVYNADGNSSLTKLQTGTKYDWLIYMMDANGNQGINEASYTP